MLAKNFKKYFLDEDSLVASYEWIRDLFQDTPEGLSTSEEEIFIDFTSSEKLKGNFVINHSLNLRVIAPPGVRAPHFEKHWFNRIWETQVFPTQWCHAHVSPFPKPGKDPTSANNYRPIALTSCLSKLMERIVSARLMFHLESHDLLSPLQSGFRKSRSTTDNLLLLETSIREAFVKKQYNISVFFDIKKAYDTSWRYGILRDLYAMDIRGNLPVFIKNFLNHRSFQVRLRSFYSNIFIQEQGVPQGSVVSVLLFIIKINSITHHINQGIQCSLYVDDVQISYSSKFLNVSERHIQTTVKNFTKWAEQNGFVFSTEKTVSVVFTRKREVFPNPELFIGRNLIEVVKEVKFLGLIFDQSLRFHRHLKDLKIRSVKALNIFKVLANTRWGADRTSLLRLYRALIRSKLDYGCVVYSSACKSLLKILDPVHHQALRLCLGAFRTSPVESLYAEAYEPPLDLRRKYLCLNYFMKIQSMKTNTAYSYLFSFNLYDFNSHRSSPTYSQPFHFRIRDLINDLNLNIGRIALCKISEVPPWKVIYPKVDFTLSYYSKACTPESTNRTLYLEHRELFPDYEPIFTDGSKSESHVGSAVVSLSTVITDALPISTSIYTAELHALRIALEHISLSCSKKFIIYIVSLPALQSIVSVHSSSHPILVDITYALANHLKKKDIRFCWIPGHAGITGNKLADTAARSATGSSERFPIPHSDVKACFRLKLQSVWQSKWDQQTENKLHSIISVLAPTAPSLSNCREQVICPRLRLGHTRLMHRHLLLGEPPPYCEKCNVSLSWYRVRTRDKASHGPIPIPLGYRGPEELGIAQRVISRLWQRFQDDGNMNRRYSTGHPRVTTPNEERYLGDTVKRNRWSTAADLSGQLSSATGTTVSKQTMYRRLGLIDDNVRPHRANIVNEYLLSEDITHMDWPAFSQGMKPLEHVWDILGRRVAARQSPPSCLPELRRALFDE
ncbi:probable RNA-directed DNA polymerase from transposon X-element [Trichonephila clavipes]|nr:probable RNA-directed DNA polymerase from transposon X-element [Trichonephila clavipes]